jgi:hypothetical protein
VSGLNEVNIVVLGDRGVGGGPTLVGMWVERAERGEGDKWQRRMATRPLGELILP